MTDKQIIIDGVDVSGCELYRNDNGVFAPDGTAERTELCYLTNDYCGNNPNCYYKQLKAKEQECDMWKNLTIDNGAVALKYQQQLDQLKAENEELREIMHKDCCTHYVLGECSQEHHSNCVGKNQCIKDLEQENKQLKVYKSIAPFKVKKLVQTLTEIKEIAKKVRGYDPLAKQILNKISEVMPNEN